MFPDSWAKTLSDEAAFKDEQAALAHVWTLLGLTTDIPNDGDWFRATLGGRSVFVQRFGDELRGFENICARQFYPLRTTDKGHGPIRCGFHHWQYNKDGLAVGIPKCQEMFGITPRELGAKLTPVEIASCGILIFGRFANGRSTETLQESFGDIFSILEAMWSPKRAPYYIETKIAANWKLVYHITLDDYHIVAVHPDTFGKNGYLPINAVRYFRLGSHSAYFYDENGDANEVARMAEQCRRGEYRPTAYRIFQFFPNLLTLHVDAGMTYYNILQQYVPLAPDRCVSRAWYFPTSFAATDRSRIQAMMRRIAAPFVPFVLPFYIRRIFKEDNDICEQIQTVAHQIKGTPILGRHEQRIAWFEETYAKLIAQGGRQKRPHRKRASPPSNKAASQRSGSPPLSQ